MFVLWFFCGPGGVPRQGVSTRGNPPGGNPEPAGRRAAFDSEHDENLTMTSDTEKKFKIINYRRFAIARDIQGKRH